MSKWEVKQPLDYSPTGDDIDSASLKIIATFQDVYDKLNRLRSNDADAGITVGDEAPFQWKIDTTTNPAALLIGNAEGTGFIRIGTIEENFGFNADTVGAVEKGGDIGKVSLGRESGLPSDAETYDLYIAYDTARVYIYLTGAWRVILSLQFGDLLHIADYVVKQEEVAERGAGKVLRLNSVGQGDIDITGSPGKIGGKDMYLPDIVDNDVLSYNAANRRWESVTNGATIANRKVDVTDIKDKDALVYDAANGRWKNMQISVLDSDGKWDGSIKGSAVYWNGRPLEINNIQDGQTLVWNFSTQAFVNANQGGVGDARNFVLSINGTQVAEYNGSERVPVDIPTFVVSTAEPSAPCIWIKPTDGGD